MQGFEGIREGMVVRDVDGKRLGRVVARGTERFLVEKGVFFREDYSAPYAEVQSVLRDEVWLAVSRERLSQAALPLVPANGTDISDVRTASHGAFWPDSTLDNDLTEAAGLPPPDWDDDEVTQRAFPFSEDEPPRYQAAATGTDAPLDGPDIDVRRRF
jgi:hypothetical protein